MDDTEQLFGRRPLRATLALTARTVERVLPLIEEKDPRRSLCVGAIHFAKQFSTASIYNALDDVSIELKLVRSNTATTPKPSLADLIVRSSALLALATKRAYRLVARYHETNTSTFDPHSRGFLAARAFRLTLVASGIMPSYEHEPRRPELKASDKAAIVLGIEMDANVVRSLSSDDWLGEPIEFDAYGIFGNLWSSQNIPTWVGTPRKPKLKGSPSLVITGEVFSTDAERYALEADVVCWFIDRSDPLRVFNIIESMNLGEVAAASSGMAPPLFLVHAPYIDEFAFGELAGAGAMIVTEEVFEGQRSDNSEALTNTVEAFFDKTNQQLLEEVSLWHPKSLTDGLSKKKRRGSSTAKTVQFSDEGPDGAFDDGSLQWLVEASKPLRRSVPIHDERRISPKK